MSDWKDTLPPEAMEEHKLWLAAKLRRETEEECEHDEHDHGICLHCGKDVWDDVVAAAEFRAECLENR